MTRRTRDSSFASKALLNAICRSIQSAMGDSDSAISCLNSGSARRASRRQALTARLLSIGCGCALSDERTDFLLHGRIQFPRFLDQIDLHGDRGYVEQRLLGCI